MVGENRKNSFFQKISRMLLKILVFLWKFSLTDFQSGFTFGANNIMWSDWFHLIMIIEPYLEVIWSCILVMVRIVASISCVLLVVHFLTSCEWQKSPLNNSLVNLRVGWDWVDAVLQFFEGSHKNFLVKGDSRIPRKT